MSCRCLCGLEMRIATMWTLELGSFLKPNSKFPIPSNSGTKLDLFYSEIGYLHFRIIYANYIFSAEDYSWLNFEDRYEISHMSNKLFLSYLFLVLIWQIWLGYFFVCKTQMNTFVSHYFFAYHSSPLCNRVFTVAFCSTPEFWNLRRNILFSDTKCTRTRLCAPRRWWSHASWFRARRVTRRATKLPAALPPAPMLTTPLLLSLLLPPSRLTYGSLQQIKFTEIQYLTVDLSSFSTTWSLLHDAILI